MLKKITTFFSRETQELLKSDPRQYCNEGLLQALQLPPLLVAQHCSDGTPFCFEKFPDANQQSKVPYPRLGSSENRLMRLALRAASRLEAHIMLFPGGHTEVTVRLYEKGRGQEHIGEWMVAYSPQGDCTSVQPWLHNPRLNELEKLENQKASQ